MNNQPQVKIPATYMRGGTSKGVFFRLQDLPQSAQTPGQARDQLLLRIIGSPDPYGKQIDGMGGATSSTSKTVIISKSTQQDHDVDYLFGQVSIDSPFVDWTGNCGNLTAAVGAFAINAGLIDQAKIPEQGQAIIRIWQANIKKTIIAKVPITNGQVQETGDFELDGVTFPAAEIEIEFIDPAEGGDSSILPTGNVIDQLELPSSIVSEGKIPASFINSGIPTIFVNAADIGYTGKELQPEINNDDKALERFEVIRSYGAVKMGLISTIAEAANRQHTPKIAMVAPPANYISSCGSQVKTEDINLLVRALSMGKLHHAMMGTAAVAIGTAAVIPGTLVNLAAGGGEYESVRFGHPSGTLKVGALAEKNGDQWQVKKVVMSRSARILMEGNIRVPVQTQVI